MTKKRMPAGIQLSVYLMSIIVMTSLSSFFPVWGNIVLAVVLPVFILVKVEMVSFEKIKLTTLVVGRFLTALTAISFFPTEWLLVIVALLMYVNIFEAVITDARKKRWENVVSGIALLSTTHILFTSTWITVAESRQIVHIGYYIITHHAMIYWMIAYTIWNFNFVTGEFSPSVCLYHVAILATPLIISFASGIPGLWMLTRATSLTTGGSLQILRKSSLESGLYSETASRIIEGMQRRFVQVVLMGIVVVLSVLSFFL